MSVPLIFWVDFLTGSPATGKTGLSPTIDIGKVARSNGAQTAAVSGGNMTELIQPTPRGAYFYILSGCDTQTYDYLGTGLTSDATVQNQNPKAMWSEFSPIAGLNNLAPGSAMTLTSGERTAIAAAVLDPAASAHNTSGTIGAKINAAGGASDPLANVVPGSYSAGSAGYALGNLIAQPGATPCTLTFSDNGGAIVGASVWVTTDSAGRTVVAGVVVTNSQGKVVVPLISGNVYYAWMTRDGENPVSGRQFTAVAD